MYLSEHRYRVWQAVNHPRVRGARALLQDLDAERSPEMQIRTRQREEEADRNARWSARMLVMELIGSAVRMGGLNLGNLSASVVEDNNSGGEAGWVVELGWWQLDGMCMRPFRSCVSLRDEHEFSHAVRAVAAALLIYALGAWARHPEQWRGGR
jgi:hypothetical protein